MGLVAGSKISLGAIDSNLDKGIFVYRLDRSPETDEVIVVNSDSESDCQIVSPPTVSPKFKEIRILLKKLTKEEIKKATRKPRKSRKKPSAFDVHQDRQDPPKLIENRLLGKRRFSVASSNPISHFEVERGALKSCLKAAGSESNTLRKTVRFGAIETRVFYNF
jgi:hypothetical protein